MWVCHMAALPAQARRNETKQIVHVFGHFSNTQWPLGALELDLYGVVSCWLWVLTTKPWSSVVVCGVDY